MAQTSAEVLAEVRWRVECDDDALRVLSAFDLLRWPRAVVEELVQQGILIEFSAASGIVCEACEEGHREEVEVITSTDGTIHWVIPCPKFGRIELGSDQRRRWMLAVVGIGALIQRQLGLGPRLEIIVPERVWDLGTTAAPERVFMMRGAGEDDGEQMMAIALKGEESDVLVAELRRPILIWDEGMLGVDRGELMRLHRGTSRERPDTPRYFLRKHGDAYQAAFGGEPFSLPRMLGFQDIATLLAQPNSAVLATDLVGARLVEGSLPLIEQDSARELRRVVRGGGVHAEEAAKFLRRATRPDGQPRTVKSPITRAANSVRNRINRAIAFIGKSSPPMAQHLDQSIIRGVALEYRPTEVVAWECDKVIRPA